MRLFLTIFFLFTTINIIAQIDSLRINADEVIQVEIPDLTKISGKYMEEIGEKTDAYYARLDRKTRRTLVKLSKWELKLKKVLDRADPQLSKKLFTESNITFSEMLEKYDAGEKLVKRKRSEYNSYQDKLTTNFKYLESKKDELKDELQQSVIAVNSKITEVNEKVDEIHSIEKLILDRKNDLINASMKMLGNNKYLSLIKKEAWYYKESIKNYKELFSTPGNAEKTAHQLLNKIPEYKKFVSNNSMLSSMFRSGGSSESIDLTGLQTRAQISSLITERLSVGGDNAQQLLQQNINEAQKQLTLFKNKIRSQGGSDDDPDFKPNTQKTKTFKQRLEYGLNLQFGKQNNYLPGSADVAFTLGYKLNDKSIIGIGASYRVGFGSINKIRFSSEGIGARSFVDWKIKKQFFVSGGYEVNYNTGFKNINQLKSINEWQSSGLIGLSRKIPIKTKFTKSTKLQILYDFLHNHHKPTTQPFIFRIGYNF